MIIHAATMPASPARQTTMIFHCFFSSLMLMEVPMWVMQIMIASVPPKGAPKPASVTISFGKKVQYPRRNSTATTNTDGIHAFVRVPIVSPRAYTIHRTSMATIGEATIKA